MDTTSELTADVNASIARAYNSGLPPSEQEAVRKHLTFILPKLGDTNSLTPQVQAALLAMQNRPARARWSDHSLVRFAGALLFAMAVAGLTYLLGWN